MKSKRSYVILGGILCLLAALFIAVACTHPELSFPWSNRVSYILYALYGIYTVIVFCMPKFKGASLGACGIAAVQFTALALIVIYIGNRNTPHESVWYLTAGLALTCAANFTIVAVRKKKQRNSRH